MSYNSLVPPGERLEVTDDRTSGLALHLRPEQSGSVCMKDIVRGPCPLAEELLALVQAPLLQ